MLKEYRCNELYVRYAVDEDPPERQLNFHVHEVCEIYYFVGGNAHSLVEASDYPLRKGSLLIMRPGEAHSVRIFKAETYARYAVNFPISVFDAFDPKRILMKPYLDRDLGQGNHFYLPGLEDIFAKMIDENLDEYTRSVVITTGICRLMEIINAEFRSGKQVKKASPTVAEQIVAYVNGNILGDISVDLLAERFFMSKSQFCKIFKEATGASPWKYITAKRLLEAGNMIAEGTPAWEAAEKCGFGDYSSFYRAHVKRFGTGPRDKGTLKSK
ncbi:MAG: AraC family transcriptional regulator [Lachnospiraceae bacterium]|nr:AraC family transcriptional regulator [Lachnospiraceae bacterium]